MKHKQNDRTIYDANHNRTVIFVMAYNRGAYETFIHGDCYGLKDGENVVFLDDPMKLQGWVRPAVILRISGFYQHPKFKEIERVIIGLGLAP